jgi:hypothetical protein
MPFSPHDWKKLLLTKEVAYFAISDNINLKALHEMVLVLLPHTSTWHNAHIADRELKNINFG